MLYRYSTAPDSKLVRKATIYIREEHKITNNDFDQDAIKIAKKLSINGYKAYIVGGAVRDLLLQKKPKDFDIATDALPVKIRKLFPSSRIIGRRFRLVHVYNSRKKVIEVSTFRSRTTSADKHVYGTLGEDAFRRDFSINALFYCPQSGQIIDYVDGIRDIKKQKVRILIPVMESFVEDPVRMIRAVKYASILGFKLPMAVRSAIKKCRYRIYDCSKERLTEEMYKILQSGSSAPILKSAYRLKLLDVLLPSVCPFLQNYRTKLKAAPVFERLEQLDYNYRQNKKTHKSEMLASLFFDLFNKNPQWASEPLTFIHKELRNIMFPLVPSNKDLKTVSRIIKYSLRRT